MSTTPSNPSRAARPAGPAVNRRRVLAAAATVAGAGGLAALLAACDRKPAQGPGTVTSKDQLTWDLVTSWPADFPLFGQAAQRIAEHVTRMSGGRLTIKVSPGGEKVPPLGVFDAVSSGQAAMGHSAAYYWSKNLPAAQFFAAIPFGMNAQQINAWLHGGGGLALWQELYEPFNVVPWPAGNAGVRMGGWFRNPIADRRTLRGLKMRVAGLAGRALAKLGVSQILLPATEVVEALSRGALDATEWVGPYNDATFGLPEVAKFYYYPGWQEPGTALELLVDKRRWDPLSDELKTMLQMAAADANQWMLCEAEAQNANFLTDLVERKGVMLRRFPDDVLRAVKSAAAALVDELANQDDAARKIYTAYQAFKRTHDKYKEVTEWAYQYAESI
ncbi:MAG: TRAP transporter substrate-binding protein [Candidatus Lambdaproteobacteria bacterium]|nr:TRAP transporter substrate-binding protein [Candidatus Lambdaproteobacteria bacterium]